MLTEQTQRLMAAVRDEDSTPDDMNAAAKALFTAASRASLNEANAAVRMLGELIAHEDIVRAGFVGLVCGAFIERGCDPLAVAEPLTARLGELLEASASLAEACEDRLPQHEGDAEAKDHDPEAEFEKVREEVAVIMPDENLAWNVLKEFWPPAIAMYSASPQARSAAQPLRQFVDKISNRHVAGHWLRLMLWVLDQEPIVVIEPASLKGFLGHISGVVENFQLNVLLMDAFPKPGFFSRRRVPQREVDIARGKGPQQTEAIVTGVWNLYNWNAIQSDLKLPDPNDYESNKWWIWNEGVPEDIQLFEGRRAILLGPHSYPRSWKSQRMFTALPAELVVNRKLTKDEAKAWLQRMLAAKGESA